MWKLLLHLHVNQNLMMMMMMMMVMVMMMMMMIEFFLKKPFRLFLDHDIIFYLDNIEKIKKKLSQVLNMSENIMENGAFANIMENGAFAPKEQVFHFP